MLIRIRGAKDGIKEYLENGHKQGREYSRDELDERVILAGDLDFTEQLIHDSRIEGERYLHITLSFKEDEISRWAMESIVADFEQFAFAAYGKDEYNFYAEAHLPRIKSYGNQKTGETIERKPHIHFVIPKTNLLSGGVLNPFGLVEPNERYIDAFQEHINNKYGLASPKDNRRIEFTDASDMIQRYKDDEFTGSSRDLKQGILSAVLDRDISNYEEFKELLAEFGSTHTRNAGKDGEYQNVKPLGNAKGVNLKEYVFSRSFIEMSADDKRAELAAEVSRKYEVAGALRSDPENIVCAMDEWYARRACEIKYINSGNARLYDRYRAADLKGKHRILAEQATKFYAKYKEPRHEPEDLPRNPFNQVYGFKRPERALERTVGEPEAPGAAQRDPGREFAHDGGGDGPVRRCEPGDAGIGFCADAGREAAPPEQRTAAQGHIYAQEQGPGSVQQREFLRLQLAFASSRVHDPRSHTGVATPRSANGLRTLSSIDVAGFRHGSQELLPDHARLQLDQQGAGGPERLRRDRDRERERGSGAVRASGRITDCRLSQRGHDLRESHAIDASDEIEQYRQIRMNLDARRLLADLSRSHGLILDKYAVIKAADGSARIICGNRKLNVSDFLTREMRLSWAGASSVLLASYGRQVESLPMQGPRLAPSPVLWRQFQSERKKLGGQRALWTQQFASEKLRRDVLKRARDMDRRSGLLTLMQRKALASVSKMRYVAAEQALTTEIRLERQRLLTPVMDQYRQFLRGMAETGDGAALSELRRMAQQAPVRASDRGGSIAAASPRAEENGIFYRGRDVRFRVHINGDVVYSLGGRAVIEDRGSRLVMLQTDRFAIEAGLRLAHAKFGSILIVSGPKEFKERAALVAAETGLDVTFEDQGLERIREQRAASLASQRAEKAYHRKLGREYAPLSQTLHPEAPAKAAPEPPSVERTPEGGGRDNRPGRERE
ncbi:MAG: relaxase/mobilization nuclease domain-containing protein [Burkholderiaceae bacterium]|nr:relaxase/mobilization nuclease domain-containing protein [Burkholderiaceae bacterium]